MLASSVEGHRMDVHDCVCKWGKNEAAWAKALCRAKQISYKSLVPAWTSDTADCRPTASALYVLSIANSLHLSCCCFTSFSPHVYFSHFSSLSLLTPFPMSLYGSTGSSLLSSWVQLNLHTISPALCSLYTLLLEEGEREGGKSWRWVYACGRRGGGLTKEEEESTGCWGREENCRGG